MEPINIECQNSRDRESVGVESGLTGGGGGIFLNTFSSPFLGTLLLFPDVVALFLYCYLVQ